jgi:hypothetical protein
MKIDGDLNLILPITFDDNGEPILYAYHTPIGQPVFEANYRILAATKAALFGKGLVFAADVGPRIAALRLEDEGKQDALERGDVDQDGNPRDGGTASLLLEIKRLTSILSPGPQGWQMLPVDTAISQKIIDTADWEDALNSLVFFTCAYALAKRHTRKNLTSALAGILKGSITSLAPLEYCDSLQKSTNQETSELKAVSSVPV